MKETETFYWKDENGEIERHHISEFGAFLERGSGHCVSGVEQGQEASSYPEPPTAYREISWNVVDQGSTPEKEVVSPIAISK